MTTARTIELALDTTEGVEQFLEYVQDVVFAAARYEADVLELAMLDPSHIGTADTLADELHELYTRMRAEIAAAVSRGGMSYEQAEKLQLQYNDLVKLRNALREAAQPLTSVNNQTPARSQRRTLTFNTADTVAPIKITASASALKHIAHNQKAPRTNRASDRPPRPPKPPRPTTPTQLSKTRATPQKAIDQLPSPGIIKPEIDRSLKQLPLLSMVTDQRLIERMTIYPRPKQLEFKIKSLIDRVESTQTDRLAAWLGDGYEHTFSFIQSLSLIELYELAALPIRDLRAELTPVRVRPESFLHWVKVVTDIQAVFQTTPDRSVGEVVVSALVLQELTDETEFTSSTGEN